MDHRDKAAFQPSGREPELSEGDLGRAPMLGGERRLWPSIAAHLLSEQHKAHRSGDMPRVWVIRRLRSRMQIEAALRREDAYLSGKPVQLFSDADALHEMQVERREIVEEMTQARQFGRRKRAAELEAALDIVDQYLRFWQERIAD